MPGGTNTHCQTSETTNLSGLIYHTSVQDVTPHAPVDSCKDIFWSRWSGVVEWSRPRITYNNICLIRGRKYSTSFHHRILRNLDGTDFCLRGFTDGHLPGCLFHTVVDKYFRHSHLLINIQLHASICFRRVLLLEEFKEHPAFCGAKSGTQGRVIVLGENSSQTVDYSML